MAATTKGVLVSLEGTQEGKNGCRLAAIPHRILALIGAYQRNDFSEPRLLHLPIQRKVLNSLTWDILFSLISKKTFDLQTTCPLLQNFYITWLCPIPLLRAVFSGLLEMLPPRLKS